jgi:hypothetical protein
MPTETTVTYINVKLMSGTAIDFTDYRTSATTVGEFKEAQGLSGDVSFNGAILEDTVPLEDGMELVHRAASAGLKGGQ